MKKELQRLKLQRKRYWKKTMNCLRGYLKMFKRWVAKPSRNKLLKTGMKREKWSNYLQAFLNTGRRIQKLENV